jgi:ribose transport system substrate-binding protein
MVDNLATERQTLITEVWRYVINELDVDLKQYGENKEKIDKAIAGIKEGFVLGTVVQDPYGYGFESVRVLLAFTKGDMSMVPENGVINIPAKVIKKDNAEAFWKDLKAKIKAGKDAK